MGPHGRWAARADLRTSQTAIQEWWICGICGSCETKPGGAEVCCDRVTAWHSTDPVSWPTSSGSAPTPSAVGATRVVWRRSAPEGGHRIVEGSELARFVREEDEAYAPEQLHVQSARNRFNGVVTRVERDKLTAIIELRAGRFRVVSLLTREAADALDLEEGDLASAVVKATDVIMEVTQS